MSYPRTTTSPAQRLQAHTAPLTIADARHGLRRAGFGAEPARAARLTGRAAEEFAREMVEEALVAPFPPAPDWADEPLPGDDVDPAENFNLRQENADRLLAYRMDWIGRMATGGLRERMALIWHNHFVTGVDKYLYAAWAHRYLAMLRTHALGNFKDFVHAVGIDPSMLIYLDGRDNLAGHGNENFARELLELFTMGPTGPDGMPNYNERDIREISRALSGWVVSPEDLEARFNPDRFDDGEKEFLGRRGFFGYDDVIDILFEERPNEIAHFVCTYLYASFVSVTVDEEAVHGMAQRFVDSGFEIAPVVEELLASERFFDPAVQGVKIKSPVEYGLSLFMDMGITDIENTLLLYRRANLLGQQLFNPPSVNGWPGHFSWINTTTLPYRAQLSETYFSGRGGGVPDLTELAAALVDSDDPHAVFRLPSAIAEHLVPLPPELLDIPAPETDFGGNLDARPIPDWVRDASPYEINLAKIFLSGAPWYEWSLDRPEANSRLVSFVTFIATYPEFHLV